MLFCDYLNSKMMSYTNKEVVTKLNLYHEAFTNLDEVTFSRWRNGKIIPSNKKIALIIIYFGDEYIEYIKKISLKNISKKSDNLVKKKSKSLSNPYFSFSSDLQCFEFNNINQLPDFLPKQAKVNMMKSVKDIEKNINRVILIKGEQSYSYSFSLVINKPVYWRSLDIELTHKHYIISPPTYYTNMNHHIDTIYLQMTYLCEHLSHFIPSSHAIFIVRTKEFDDYYHIMGYNYLKKVIINNKNYYIYEGKVIDFLTSERVINILRSY